MNNILLESKLKDFLSQNELKKLYEFGIYNFSIKLSFNLVEVLETEESENSFLKSEVERLEWECSKLENDLYSEEMSCLEYKDEIREYEYEIKDLKTEVEKLKKEIDILKKEDLKMLITKEQFKKIAKKHYLYQYVATEEIDDLFQSNEALEQTKLADMLFNLSCGAGDLDSGSESEYYGSEKVFELSKYISKLTVEDIKKLQ